MKNNPQIDKRFIPCVLRFFKRTFDKAEFWRKYESTLDQYAQQKSALYIDIFCNKRPYLLPKNFYFMSW